MLSKIFLEHSVKCLSANGMKNFDDTFLQYFAKLRKKIKTSDGLEQTVKGE